MSKYKTVWRQLEVIDGLQEDTSDLVAVVEPSPLSGNHKKGNLYVLVEPATNLAKAKEACALVAETIKRTYYTDPSSTVSASLKSAISAANEVLRLKNDSEREHRRVEVGLTCAVVKGDFVYLAQVLPGQAFLLQQDGFQSVPDAERDDSFPTIMGASLGGEAEPDVNLWRAETCPGDILLFCTGPVVDVIAQEGPEHVLAAPNAGELLQQIYKAARRSGVIDASALTLEFGPAAEAGLATQFPVAQRAQEIMGGIQTAAYAWAGQAAHVFASFRRKAPRVAAASRSGNLILGLDEDAGPWTGPSRHRATELFPPSFRQEPRVRARRPRVGRADVQRVAASALGMLALMLRQMVPDRSLPNLGGRLKALRISLPLLIGVVLAIGIVASAGLAVTKERAERQRLEHINSLFSQAQQLRSSAMENADHTQARVALADALKVLDAAKTAGGDSGLVADQRVAIAKDMDQINGIVRLGAGEQLLDLSQTGSAAGPIGQIVAKDDVVYLLGAGTSGVYRYKVGGKEVQQLLVAGSNVAGQAVGSILSIAATDSGILALDSKGVAFSLDQASGQWNAAKLGSGIGAAPAAVDTFDGNAYLLGAKPNQILKYANGAYADSAVDWIAPDAGVDVTKATGMAIDGSIYLLFSDGQILKMTKGEPDSKFQPAPYPPITGASAIVSSSDHQRLWILDVAGSRVIEVGKDGKLLRQYMADADSKMLEGARSLAVDEKRGLIYIGNGSSLYSAGITVASDGPAPGGTVN